MTQKTSEQKDPSEVFDDQERPAEECQEDAILEDARTEEAKCQADGMPTNLPDLRQISVCICSLMLGELDRANKKYPPFFRSSVEAQGTIRQEFLEVEEIMRAIKSVNGMALDEESLANGKFLKDELIQLGAMCIKAGYSLCNFQDELEVASKILEEQQRIAQMIHDNDQAEQGVPVATTDQADEPTL